MFGRATMTLGIGPHSSLVIIYYRFTVEFAVETTFKICEHLTKLQAYDIKTTCIA